MLLLFFGSNGAQKKSVKLKKHKQKKWNIFRISVKEIEREKKNIEKRITNLQSTVHSQFTKRTTEIIHLFRESLATSAQVMPAKRLKRLKRLKVLFANFFIVKKK